MLLNKKNILAGSICLVMLLAFSGVAMAQLFGSDREWNEYFAGNKNNWEQLRMTDVEIMYSEDEELFMVMETPMVYLTKEYQDSRVKGSQIIVKSNNNEAAKGVVDLNMAKSLKKAKEVVYWAIKDPGPFGGVVYIIDTIKP